jgi:hypothetical protein
MYMKRRYILLSGLGAACGVLGWRFAHSSDESAFVKVLYNRLHYLRLDDAGVRRFARDLKEFGKISSLRLRLIDAAGPLYTGLAHSPSKRLSSAIRHGEERVVTQYLISSDFFKNGADESRVVNYLGYYDPMVACSSPFARPVTYPMENMQKVPV